jgi:polyamine oxidase
MPERRDWSMLPRGAEQPRGAHTPRPRVAVVGAGMAGLVAARLLHDSGCAVTVYEARDRLGGRVWTEGSLGVPIDLGGSWIHGADDNPLTDWCQSLGIAVLETSAERAYYVDGAAAAPLQSIQRRAWKARGLSEIAIGAALWRQRAARAIGLAPEVSLADVVGPLLRAPWLSPFDRRVLALTVSTSEGVQGAPADKLAIEEWFPAEAFKSNAMPEGGFVHLIDDAARGLEVRLLQPVSQVAWSGEGVRLAIDGREEAADYAIVTVPLGILQAGRLTFAPALPGDQAAAISRLGYGGDAVLGKLYLRFSEPFWPKGQIRMGTLPQTPERRGRFATWFSLERETGAPILLGFANGRAATWFEREASDAEVLQIGLEVLRSIFPGKVPEPVAFRFTRWLTDPWALGSYSYPAVGSHLDDRRIYARPVADRVMLAGEGTEDGSYGTVHAALQSGERAAETVFTHAFGVSPERTRRPWKERS